MSGHSKWANIKHKKEKSDSQRAKVFTKIGREMAVAIKEGGPDPAVNGKLRDLIAKAKANNVPNDNIERAIKKAAADAHKNTSARRVHQAHGPHGVSVIVDALTDNRNRTAADVRHFFDKFGGNLGNTGCVSYLFSKKGIVVLENDGSLEEDAVMEDVMEAGAEDMDFGEEAIEIECETGAVSQVREYLADKGYTVVSAEVEQVPSTYVTLTDEDDIRKMNLLLDNLEDDDDIQNVFHNWEMPEE